MTTGAVIEPPGIFWLGPAWVFIFAGAGAAAAARTFVAAVPKARRVVVLERGRAPRCWAVAQQRVCICDTGGADVDEIVAALVRACAAKVAVADIDLGASWWAARLGDSQFSLDLQRAGGA